MPRWPNSKPSIRSLAKEAGKSVYFTGKACPKGHIAMRRVHNGECVDCGNQTSANFRQKNSDLVKKYNKSNKTKLNEQKINWRDNNQEKTKLATKKWYKNNTAKVFASVRNRNLAKIQRTPNWLNVGHIAEIESVYEYCSALRQAGLDYHVDHIVPLRGKTVSGLHVPWNLQVIPGSENMSKGNRFNG
jgi:hypothetical protein